MYLIFIIYACTVYVYRYQNKKGGGGLFLLGKLFFYFLQLSFQKIILCIFNNISRQNRIIIENRALLLDKGLGRNILSYLDIFCSIILLDPSYLSLSSSIIPTLSPPIYPCLLRSIPTLSPPIYPCLLRSILTLSPPIYPCLLQSSQPYLLLSIPVFSNHPIHTPLSISVPSPALSQPDLYLDLVIGRCVSDSRTDPDVFRMGPLSGPPMDLLEAEMRRVFSQVKVSCL